MADSTNVERIALKDNMSSAEKNRALNDHFRKTGEGGIVTLSMGLHKLGQAEVANVMKLLAGEKGDKSIEPNTEHECGEVQVGHRTICWDIGYYNKELEDVSLDPTDPNKTIRYLTLMLSTEY